MIPLKENHFLRFFWQFSSHNNFLRHSPPCCLFYPHRFFHFPTRRTHAAWLSVIQAPQLIPRPPSDILFTLHCPNSDLRLACNRIVMKYLPSLFAVARAPIVRASPLRAIDYESRSTLDMQIREMTIIASTDKFKFRWQYLWSDAGLRPVLYGENKKGGRARRYPWKQVIKMEKREK